MRITFLLPPVNMSGGIKVVAIYADFLHKRGHKVVLVSPPPPREGLLRRVRNYLLGRSVDSKSESHLDTLDLDHRLLERYRKPGNGDVPDADVIIATWWETAEWVNELSASKGAKAYFIQHHEIFDYLPLQRVHATYRLPLHKIVIAEWLRKVMKEQYQDETVDLVSNSVDLDRFYSHDRDKQPVPTLAFLYNPTPFKGVDVTISAVRSLQEKLGDLRVLCFGVFPAGDDLLSIPGVEYSLNPSQERIRDIYASSDVWLTASRSEGFNLPAMEAMACRTPVVSTRTGWPDEAIDPGKNGYLIDIDDVKALADCAEAILKLDEAGWKACSAHAYQTVAGSSWESSSLVFEQALKHACKRAENHEISGRCNSR